MNPVLSSLVGESTTPASGVQQALTNGFTTIASDMTTTITNILPIILGIVGMIAVIGFAIRFFNQHKNGK